MDARETVQKGLDARKNVKAAEARAERYRETVDVIRDTLFREQMSHKRARASWLEEKTVLTSIINRQHDTIVRLREEKAVLEDRVCQIRERRALINGAKAVGAFALLICARDMGWIVNWLCDSLLAVSVTCFLFAIARLTHQIK